MSSYDRLLKLANRFERKVAEETESKGTFSKKLLREVVHGHIEAMLQNSFYEPGSNLTFEQYGMTANDLSPDALMEIMDDAEKFLKSAAKEGVDLSKYLHGDSLGRGLWYARQYKEWDDMGEEDALILSKIGKEYRELDPRMGDNDEICI